jgi:hypothetical protein
MELMFISFKYPKLLLAVIVILTFKFNSLQSQVVTWSVNFNNGCAANCLATTYGGWTVQDNVGGVTGGAPNNWFVSCAEEGITPPGCGSSCIGDQCLHIGANAGAGGDMGASFNETGATNATYRRAVSPTINLTGVSSNTLYFDFIAFGSAACSDDRAQLHLSTDNGATWPVGYQYCLTSLCCGACNGYSQGQWTLYSLALPAAFDNNPTVRIGFHWRNNGNGSGTDPSVAIDDTRILSPSLGLPLTLLEFKSLKENKKTKLDWTTASEINFSRFDIERSFDAKSFTYIGTVNSKGGNGKSNYNFLDKDIQSQTAYYRLKMIDKDNTFSYSKIVSSSNSEAIGSDLYLISQSIFNDNLNLVLGSKLATAVIIEVYDVRGKQVINLNDEKLNPGENNVRIDIASLNPAVYFLKISSVVDGKSVPLVITEKIVRTK